MAKAPKTPKRDTPTEYRQLMRLVHKGTATRAQQSRVMQLMRRSRAEAERNQAGCEATAP